MTKRLEATCLNCGLNRTALAPEWIETARAGREPHQIDTGEDFMFSGLIVAVPEACPRCRTRGQLVVLPESGLHQQIGGYIERFRAHEA